MQNHPSNGSARLRFYGGFFVVCLGAFALYLASLARGPDRDLTFVRDVPTELDAITLSHSIEATINWPKWFFSLDQALAINVAGVPYSAKDQVIAKGSLVKLMID